METTAPLEIDGARVLSFIKIEKFHKHTSHTKHFVNGLLQGPAYRLAICKYDTDDGYYLFSCDAHWQTITDTYHDSEEDAMKQGEFEYEGTLGQWLRK